MLLNILQRALAKYMLRWFQTIECAICKAYKGYDSETLNDFFLNVELVLVSEIWV
jgi:hypothetical protein